MDLKTTITKTLLGEKLTIQDVIMEQDLPQEHKDIIKNQGLEVYNHFLRNEKLKKQPNKAAKLNVLTQWKSQKHINHKQFTKHVEEL